MKLTIRHRIKAILVALTMISGPTHATTSTKKVAPTKNFFSKEELEKLVHAHSERTIPQAVRFLSLAMQAWNPTLRNTNLNAMINSNIKTYGVVIGLVNPTIALMDISFAAGRPEFGNLLNPMLTQVTPELGSMLNRKYGMAMDYEGRDFDTISQYGNADIWTTMTHTLGGEFYANNAEGNQSNTFDQNRDLATQIFQGRGSFYDYKVQREIGSLGRSQDLNDEAPITSKTGFPSRHNDYTSTPGYRPGADPSSPGRAPFRTNNRDLTSNPGRSDEMPNEGRAGKFKGPFSNRNLSAYQSCFNECYNNAADNVPKGSKAGGVIGGAIGTLAGGPAGGITGGIIGGLIGAGVGVGAGIDNCRHSKACGGNGGDTGKPEPSKPNEPKVSPEPKQPKTDPKPEPKTHPSPEPKPESDPKPEGNPTPHPDKTPIDDENGDDDDDNGKKDEDGKKSISLGQFGKDTLKIPGTEKKPIEIRSPGKINPINSTPSVGDGMGFKNGRR